MSKKILKILTIIIYILFITCIISNTYATNISNTFKGSLGELKANDITSVEKILINILAVIRTVGMFIAVGILMVIACKYIVASAGDRADIKKYAISYIIGAIILFATSGIAQILQKLIEGAFNTNASK